MSVVPKTPGGTAQYAFQDPSLPGEDRISDLIQRMTLDEKVKCFGTQFDIPRLGVRGPRFVEGLHGLAQWGEAEWQPQGERKSHTTTFPQAYGLGHTWNPALIREVAKAEATECRYLFHHPDHRGAGLVLLAPNADLGRDPRWGRTEECFGEDPCLVGNLTVAFVKGLQGDDPDHWPVASLMKHYLANSHEVGREDTSSDFDDQMLHDYYAVGFRRGVTEGGSRAYMACYNGINGIPGCVSPLHRELSITKWGQDGIICTDGGALGLLITHHKYLPNVQKGAAACVKAGMNIFLDKFEEGMRASLELGDLTEKDLDEGLRRMFRVVLKLGLLDANPDERYAELCEQGKPWMSQQHRDLAKKATDQSLVLLKNDGILPVSPAKERKVLVVGRYADQVMFDWYSGTPPYAVSPVEGITEKFDAVTFVTGADAEEAVSLAKESDLVIVVAGNHPTGNMGWAQVERQSDGKESVDRLSLELEDEPLIQALHAANPRTVLVLQSSFPYAIRWCQQNLPAILFVTHSSQETGNSIADALVGQVNPGGKLTQTWPASMEDLPEFRDYDLRNGRTYMYAKSEPLYPFGYGLSYTEFLYGEVTHSETETTIDLAVPVSNLGSVKGDQVIQVYASYPQSKRARPIRHLVGFARVEVAAEQTVVANISIPQNSFETWDTETNAFIEEPGEVELLIGTSSKEIFAKLILVRNLV